MKSKKTAALLSLFLGMWGVHRFYLGQKFRAFLHLLLFFGLMGATVEEGAPFILIAVIIGAVEAILFAVMPKEEFNEKYNNKIYRAQYFTTEPREYLDSNYENQPESRSNFNPYKSYGIQQYKKGDFVGAKSEFQKALGLNYESSSIHFNLACCLSQLQDVEKALFHLGKAIEFGFHDLDRIHEHEGLGYIRNTQQFEQFVENGYRTEIPSIKIQSSQSDTNQEQESENGLSLTLLEQINQLGKLKESGLITEEEFSLQKKKILSEDPE